MISIRTVGRQDFKDGCGRLWDTAQESFRPQLVVGIRSGGWWVAEEMKAARAPTGVIFLPLTARRPSTDIKGKSRVFKLLLKILPYFMLDFLRLVEYYVLTLPRCRSVARHGIGDDRSFDAGEMTVIRSAVANLPAASHVLVVDDSLDSGATLASVINALRSVLPSDAQVRSAAFTVLGPAPIIAADFYLYRSVNCRFPWSFDFHG